MKKIRLRRSSPQGRAELKAFHGGVVGMEEPKNRKSQLLLVLALTATFFGAWLSVAGVEVVLGLLLVAVGLPSTIAIAAWCVRNWTY